MRIAYVVLAISALAASACSTPQTPTSPAADQLILAWPNTTPASGKWIVVEARDFERSSYPDAIGGVNIGSPFWTPTHKEGAAAYKALNDYVRIARPPRMASNEMLRPGQTAPETHLSEFDVQLTGVTVRPSNEKLVVMKGSCRGYKDWETQWVFDYGGGSCFFEAAYSPRSKTVLSFSYNSGE